MEALSRPRAARSATVAGLSRRLTAVGLAAFALAATPAAANSSPGGVAAAEEATMNATRSDHPAAAHLDYIVVDDWPRSAVDALRAFHCPVASSYSGEELAMLQKMNCGKVHSAILDFVAFAKNHSLVGSPLSKETAQDWQRRADLAAFLCHTSGEAEDNYTAAWLAINAWGAGIMDGAQCCNLPHAPYCVAESATLSSLAVGALLGLLGLLFVGAAIASCLVRPAKAERQPLDTEEDHALPFGTARGEARLEGDRLYDELQHFWLDSHCLRALPDAQAFAQAAATTFALLQSSFDFQPDSVRNQYEHLLSLWRSHCATVADRSVQAGEAVDEAGLLAEALGDLHAELLEGFGAWRAGYYKAVGLQADKLGKTKPAALRRQDHLRGVPASSAQQLVEVAAFLLVWGEAGNVRFMPEVLYFLSELVLSADGSRPEDFYGHSAAAAATGMGGAPFRSHLFLAKIIRPIYNAIFDAWHERVDVDPEDGRNIKKLHAGFETYLPPDVANYDDWNELFCNSDRLVQGLFMEDGTSLFDKPPGQRFATLHRLDWVASLDPYEVKTHREVHSLWGVFASTHRIWLLHAVFFCMGLCFVIEAPEAAEGANLLQGGSLLVRLAAIGLLVPVHGLLWAFARWETSSQRALRRARSLRGLAQDAGLAVLWVLPIVTYIGVRWADLDDGSLGSLSLELLLLVHFAVSAAGLLSHLAAPARKEDMMWRLTTVPMRDRALRYIFWLLVLAVKTAVSIIIFRAVAKEAAALDLTAPGRESVAEIREYWYSTTWGADALLWLLLWSMCFFLFVADTGVWYQVGCSLLGICTILSRRKNFALERAISKIPERFSQKVFLFSSLGSGGASGNHRAQRVSSFFPMMWDRIIETMHQEDKCNGEIVRDQSFGVRSGLALSEGPPPAAADAAAASEGSGSSGEAARGASATTTPAAGDSVDFEGQGSAAKMPDLFNRDSILTMGRNGALVTRRPRNVEMQWRLNSFARCLGMPMPRPFRAPYIPGITVLIPHFQEDIIATREDLYTGREETVPLIDWLKARYPDEFDALLSRVKGLPEWQSTPEGKCRWSEYSEQQWDTIAMWASMRLQTLWRTVAGMSMYEAVLQCHFEAQADEASALAARDVWDPADCFTCLVSMQQYKVFSQRQIEHTNRMLTAFPASVKIAFIDWNEKNITAETDGVHQRQRRRYFSCLIDRDSQMHGDGRREAKLRIELPGFPILGDGKSDNQNHAIPFMRGAFCQCIDSNQGAYLEQMLLLPCVLGEFRTKHRSGNQAKRIIGLPEHITSDFGSIGDFAAGAELAFGTVLQRSHALLGARMHYGHPDIMNKQYMIQQGGVSKATKTLNLSEDIFAGMDFLLRGQGRQIRHCEYFYLTKGRDLGFNAVMGFFSKISSGTGEQILTRQMFRLGQILHLPEALSFFYAHAGYYLTQAFVSLSMAVMVSTWLVVLASDCESTFRAFMNCPEASASEAMASTLSAWCSWVIAFFLVAQAVPLFAQVWMEMGLRSALVRLAKQWLTCSWLFFIFQAKLVGFFVLHEVRYGGAMYVGTGRGLPTQRSPFVGRLSEDGSRLKKVGGLYLDYARLAYYDGVKLLLGAVLAGYLGGIAGGFAWTFIGLTIFSWLYAPFVFNPYQFSRHYFWDDLHSWFTFFFRNGSCQWVAWYNATQLHPRRGFRHSVWDIKAFLGYFVLAVWFAIVHYKVSLFRSIFSIGSSSFFASAPEAFALLPPIAAALAFCLFAACAEGLAGACCPRPRRSKATSARELGGGAPVAASGPEPSMFNSAAEEEDEEEDESAESADRTASSKEKAKASAHSPSAAPTLRGSPASAAAWPLLLPLAALVVVGLEAAEGVLPLLDLQEKGWHRAFVSGLMLKFLTLRLVLFLSEGVLRCRFFGCLGVIGRPLELFVQANRLAKDIFVSSFLFATLSVGMLLNTLNEVLCPGCNLHQLLIYRSRPLRPELA